MTASKLSKLPIFSVTKRTDSCLSILRTCVRAVDSINSTVDQLKLSSSIPELRFFQRVSNSPPALPKYDVTWDPEQVFQYFLSQPPSTQLSLPQLYKKLITLLALATGHRMQTLAAIRLP